MSSSSTSDERHTEPCHFAGPKRAGIILKEICVISLETDPAPIVGITGVSKTYGHQRVLSDVHLTLERGRIYALCGLNGSGKSTLIKVLTGVISPDAGGTITIDGAIHAALTPALARAAGIDVIFQDLSLFPNLSVAENIVFGRLVSAPAGLRRRKAAVGTARVLLERLGSKIDPKASVETLSIAERQIVAIARALVGDARLLILDEPTASLTDREATRLMDLVRKLAESGVTIIYVSHRYAEVAALADEVIVLRDGQLVRRHDADTLTATGLATDMSGQAPGEKVTLPAPATGQTLLEARALSRAGEYNAVNLQVRAGDIVGITGLLGSGRTELAKTLFGITRPDEGEIRVDDKVVDFASNRAGIQAGIAYVPEDRLALGLVLEASIADNIALSVRRRVVSSGLIDTKRTKALVNDLIRDLGIKAPDVDAPVSTLSGGNQQRVVIAKWLATNPTVLILDSPTVGVDVTAREAIYALIRELATAGKGLIIISDEFEEVLSNATVLHVMKSGHLSPPLDPKTLTEETLAEIVNG